MRALNLCYPFNENEYVDWQTGEIVSSDEAHERYTICASFEDAVMLSNKLES